MTAPYFHVGNLVPGPWVADAACAGEPRDLWFVKPDRHTGNREAREMVAPAKAICAVCPVRSECLDHALANNETDGIWGGMTRNERNTERRARARAK